MKFWRTSANALVFGVALAALAYPAKAADTTKITYAYFEHPVEVPGGKVLPQGEYAFKMVDESSSVKVVQILMALPGGTVGTPSNYNANKPMEVAATLLAVSDYRNRRGRGTVTYWQARGGGPNALRALNFPLDDNSLASAYPQARALRDSGQSCQPACGFRGLVSQRGRQRDEGCRSEGYNANRRRCRDRASVWQARRPACREG